MSEPAPSTAKEIKKALRQRILALRDQIPPEVRVRVGETVFARTRALPQYRAARVVFAYAGFGSELDTAPLLQQILDDGKLLVMSKVDKAARGLTLFQVDELDAHLVPGVWGIREPNPDRCAPCAPDAVDLVVMPGAVFDVYCGRIGYGAGYYDRLLAPLQPVPYLVAPAFDLQVIEEVPMEPHDKRLDRVITERHEIVPPARA